MTRPWFRGYSTLARIVDNENTIENNRKPKKTKKNRNLDTEQNYILWGSDLFPKEIINNFAMTNDITEFLEYKVNSIRALKILDVNGFRQKLRNNKEFKNSVITMAEMVVNIFVDENKCNQWKDKAKSKYNAIAIYDRCLIKIKKDYLKNEIEMRRRK